MKINVIPNDLIIEIDSIGEVEFNDLYAQIRGWEASPVGIVYEELADGEGNRELGDGSKSPKHMILKDGWKLRSNKPIIVIGGIITGKGKDGFYNPISIDSKENITILTNIEDWQVTEEQIARAKELGKAVGKDWEVSSRNKSIKRKANADPNTHEVLGLYWFLKVLWLEDKSLKKFELPITGDNKIPYKGLIREFELKSDWKISKKDLSFLSGVLIQSGKILIQTVSGGLISLRDRSNVDPVLGVKDVAREVALLIESMPSEVGRMIGVFGKWGRGKTFLFNEIWNILRNNSLNIKAELHAWKYQDTPAIWAYLYENFANSYFQTSKSFLDRVSKRVKLNIIRMGWSPLLIYALSAILSLGFTFLIPFEIKLHLLLKLLLGVGIGPIISVIIFYFRNRNTARELFKKYFSEISFKNVLGIQAEVEKELHHLISAMTNSHCTLFSSNNWNAIKRFNISELSFRSQQRKIVLFVEDIDRCSESKIIQIIDSLRVMLEDEVITQKVIVVAAIDGDILGRAIMSKYHHLVQMRNDSKPEQIEVLDELTSEYLDKLFLISLKLGRLSPEEIEEFYTELTKFDRNADSSPINQGTQEKLETTKELNQNNSSSPTEPLSKDEIELNLELAQLSDDEFEFNLKWLKNQSDLTPRQIRIIHFRFLLARNLLATAYNKLGRKNIWIESPHLEILIRLLIGYSINRSSLDEHLEKVANSNNRDDDYFEVLKVINVVVAY